MKDERGLIYLLTYFSKSGAIALSRMTFSSVINNSQGDLR